VLQRPTSTVEDKELELFAEEIPPVSAGNGPGGREKTSSVWKFGLVRCVVV